MARSLTDHARAVYDVIALGTWKRDQRGFARIPKTALSNASYLTSSCRKQNVIEWLTNHHYIDVCDIYSARGKHNGGFAKGYKIKRIWPTEPESSWIRPEDNKVYGAAAQFDLDITRIPFPLRYDRLVWQLENKRYTTAPKRQYGRLYTDWTRSNREIRKGLRYNGEPVTSLDIKSCNPFLIACLSKEERWIEQYRDGFEFYAWLGGGEKSVGRDHFNTICNAKSWNWEKDHAPAREKLAEEYPRFFKWIVDEHKRDKRAGKDGGWRSLSELEGEIMIDNVLYPAISARIPIISIHDAVIVPQEYVEEIREMINTACVEILGYQPVLKEEVLD